MTRMSDAMGAQTLARCAEPLAAEAAQASWEPAPHQPAARAPTASTAAALYN